MTSVIWGWRLEAMLGFVALILLKFSVAFGGFGIILVGGVLAGTSWQLPELRRGIASALKEARDRRRIVTALWRCLIVGRYGYVPRTARTAELPIGRRYLLALPTGLHFAELELRVGELAAELRAREVRVVVIPQSAGYVELVVVMSVGLRRRHFPDGDGADILARSASPRARRYSGERGPTPLPCLACLHSGHRINERVLLS